jgi:hypothetical protein
VTKNQKDRKKLEARMAALERRVRKLEKWQWLERLRTALCQRLASGV